VDTRINGLDCRASQPSFRRSCCPLAWPSKSPGHAIAKAQQTGFGTVLSFEIAGGVDAVRRFVEAVEIFSLAESLGGIESLVSHSATMTDASMSPDTRSAAGISDSLVRLSIGLENEADLAADLARALNATMDRAWSRV
jgi:cystathionine gamma-synthase